MNFVIYFDKFSSCCQDLWWMIINLVKIERRIFIIILRIICKMKKSYVYFYKYTRRKVNKEHLFKSKRKFSLLNEKKKKNKFQRVILISLYSDIWSYISFTVIICNERTKYTFNRVILFTEIVNNFFYNSYTNEGKREWIKRIKIDSNDKSNYNTQE